MDYEKMKGIARSQGITLKTLADSVGMSEPGFHKAIKEGSFRVVTLEDCAKVLGVSVCALMDCQDPGGLLDIPFRDKYYNILERYNDKLEENMELRRKLNFYENGGGKNDS